MAFDFSAFKISAQKVLEHTRQEVATLRTGRANVQILDPVQIEAYGTRMRISELAAISVPDSNMLIISPWDKSLLGSIERGINEANMNLSPVVDGQIIRIVIPALTQERREEMVKLLHQKAEAAKAMLRSVRSDVKREIEKQEGQPGISEDNIAGDLDSLDSQFKVFEEKLEQMTVHKQQELMSL